MSLGVIVTLIFLVLKLIHEIDWSWWWVLSPVLAEIGIDIAIFVAVVGGVAVRRSTKAVR